MVNRMAKMDLKTAYNKVDNLCCSNHNVATLTNMSIDKGIIPDRIDFFEGYNETHDEDFCKDADEMIAALEVIKEVVDLQDELGCPLKVLLKLVDQNELYYQFYDELQHWTSIKVDLRKRVVWYCKQVGGHYACSQPLSNYGKTFWLKEDKSE